jgi:hypothetical protein
MAYDRTELRLLTNRMVAEGMNIWQLDSIDTLAVIIASGYISNAKKLLGQDGVGMNVGDKVIVRRYDSLVTKANLASVTDHYVTAVADAGATLSEAGASLRPVIEDALAVTLTAQQSGALIVLDKLDGVVVTLPAPQVGLFFDFVVDTASTSVGQKVITDAVTTFIKGTVLQMTAADAANVLDTANGSTHRAVTMNGTTTGGVVGSRFRLTCRSATIWEVEGLILASGSVATSFTTS